MKKCFALLLTLLLALGLTATAFAVEEEPPTRSRITVDGQTYEDITEVPITKLYQLVNDGTVSPAETFRFSIAADSVTDSAITAAADMPVFTPSTFDIAFSEGAATAAGASSSFALPLPEFSSVGIYTYKITESAGGTIEAAAATAEFTNTKGGSIDNGVLLDSAPYAVLLTMAAAGGAAMFLRRRSQRS